MDYNNLQKSDDSNFLSFPDIEEIFSAENIHIKHLSVLDSANKKAIHQQISLLKFIIFSNGIFNDLYKEFKALNNRTLKLKHRLNEVSHQVKSINSKCFAIPDISELLHQYQKNINKINLFEIEQISYITFNQSTNLMNLYKSAVKNYKNDIKLLIKYKSDVKNGILSKPDKILQLNYTPDNSVDLDISANHFQQRIINMTSTSIQENLHIPDCLSSLSSSVSHFSHDTSVQLSNDIDMAMMPLKHISLDNPPLPAIKDFQKDSLLAKAISKDDDGNSDVNGECCSQPLSKSRSLSAEPVNWSDRSMSQPCESALTSPLVSICVIRSSQPSMQVAIDTSGQPFDRYQLVRRDRQISRSRAVSSAVEQNFWNKPGNFMTQSHEAAAALLDPNGSHLTQTKYHSWHLVEEATSTGLMAVMSRDKVEQYHFSSQGNKPIARSISMPCKSSRQGLILGCVTAEKEKSGVASTARLQRSNSFVQRALNFFKNPPTRGAEEHEQLAKASWRSHLRQRSPSPMTKRNSSAAVTQAPLLRKSRGREKSTARFTALGVSVSRLAEQIRNRSRSSSASAAKSASRRESTFLPAHSNVCERLRTKCKSCHAEEVKQMDSRSDYLANIEAIKQLQIDREEIPWRVNTFPGVSMLDFNAWIQNHNDKKQQIRFADANHLHVGDGTSDKEMMRPLSYPQNVRFGNTLTLATTKKPPKAPTSLNKMRCSVPCQDFDAHGRQIDTFCVNQNTAEQLRRLSQQFSQAVPLRRSYTSWSKEFERRENSSSGNCNGCSSHMQHLSINVPDSTEFIPHQHKQHCLNAQNAPNRLLHFQQIVSPLQEKAYNVRHSVSTDSAVELNLTLSDQNRSRSDGTDCSLTSSAGNGSSSHVQPQLLNGSPIVNSAGDDSSFANVDKYSDELPNDTTTAICDSRVIRKMTLKNNVNPHAPVPPPRITSLTRQLLNSAPDKLSDNQEPIYAQVNKRKKSQEDSSQPKFGNVSSTATIQLQSSSSFNDFKSFYNKFPYRSGTLSSNLSSLLRKRNSVPYDDEVDTNIKLMSSSQPQSVLIPCTTLSAEQINLRMSEKRNTSQLSTVSSTLALPYSITKSLNFASKASVHLFDSTTSIKNKESVRLQQHQVIVPFPIRAADTRLVDGASRTGSQMETENAEDAFSLSLTPFTQLHTNVSRSYTSIQPSQECPFTRLSGKSLLVKNSSVNNG